MRESISGDMTKPYDAIHVLIAGACYPNLRNLSETAKARVSGRVDLEIGHN